MPFIILGQRRFALPIGETRIGGNGSGSLPFAEVADHAPVATLVVGSDGAVTLHRLGKASGRVSVDGVAVSGDPVPLAHGAMIEAAGVRLVYAELRELRTPTDITRIDRDHPRSSVSKGPAQPTGASGGQLVAAATGAVVPIADSGLVIGRAPDSDLVIPARDVSRRHAVIRPSPDGYVLRDVSTNGTYVNGRRVSGQQLLGMGDIIRIGSEEFRFEANPSAFQFRGVPRTVPKTPAWQGIEEPPTAPPPVADSVVDDREDRDKDRQ
jgi:hypothetical protein